MDTRKQEPRSERVTLAVTPTEKRALQFVANVRSYPGHVVTESELMRSMLLGDVVAEYERMMDRLREAENEAA